MNKLIAAALAAIVLLAASILPAAAQDRVQVGRLSCEVAPGIGYLIGSQKEVLCKFTRKGYKTEVYDGTISKLGLDIGFTERTRIEWLVFSIRGQDVKRGSLRGTYVGASGEASLGVGGGANWLIGGSRRGFALQPWSIQGTVGVNLTWAFSSLSLH